MKFQKTLLAATLAVVGFSAQANVVAAQEVVAQEAVKAIGTANLAKYDIGGTEYIFVESVKDGTPYLVAGQFYTVGENDQLIKAAAQVIPEGLEAISKGQITFEYNKDNLVLEEASSKTEDGAGGNVAQNNYWYAGTTTTDKTALVENPESLQLMGKLVNPNENGNTAGFEDEPFASIKLDGGVTGGVETITTVRKDIQIGNLTEQPKGTNTNGLTNYQFQLEKNQAQGTLATIQTNVNGNTAVAGVTGNGLAVLDVPKGGLVDLEKGTVTFTTTTGGEVVRTALDTGVYKTDAGNVLRIDGKYFVVSANGQSLEAYTGDTSQFVKADGTAVFEDGKGLSEEKSGSKTETSVNTGLVSNQNVTYGESVTTVEAAASIQVSVTNPEFADSLSGETFALGETSVKTTSKDVVTGIIAVDQETGEKTYGVQATTVVDNKVTGQTTLTANGIETTGDITFVDAATGDKTSVKGYLEETSKAVDAKVDAALVEVDSRLTQFNTTANRLNQRIDDVEETAYRGVAIALAAQQQIPNIGAGQFAVFGGVGHYEGESAAALGLASVLADGRTSFSAALGAAGNGEVGGRVGMAYVFGGK